MLTVEVKINGRLIGTAKAVNYGGNMNGVCSYRCEGETETNTKWEHKEFEFHHDRNKGPWALVEKLAEEMSS